MNGFRRDCIVKTIDREGDEGDSAWLIIPSFLPMIGMCVVFHRAVTTVMKPKFVVQPFTDAEEGEEKKDD